MNNEFKFLSWFLGPKAENGADFLEYIKEITNDYLYWRRNYFPDDKILINRGIQKQFEFESYEIHNKLIELLSGLKRNFPFYSPRYIGHMLSDILMPSTLGYYAGMLYNPNNVTPEAAPVTTEWEIDVCEIILQMLGYKPSPCPPPLDSKDRELWIQYQLELNREFGWAHITSGGTVANIEALWVARTIKYYSLNILAVARKEKISISTLFPDGKERNLLDETIDEYDILNITPNQAINLLSKFLYSVLKKYKYNNVTDAKNKAMELLSDSDYCVKSKLYKVLSKYEPVILVSGTAHYSIRKAADILGIGYNNVVAIKVDSDFRMIVSDLEEKLQKCFNDRKVPIAVIGIVGTTEEGAIDPIHKISDLRESFENNQNKSFWLHIDAAWGGFIRSIFNLSDKQEIEVLIEKLCGLLRIKKNIIDYKESIAEIENKITKVYLDSFSVGQLRDLILETHGTKKYDLSDADVEQYRHQLEREFRKSFYELSQYYIRGDFDSFTKRFEEIIRKYNLTKIKGFPLRIDDFETKLQDRIVSTSKYMKSFTTIKYGFSYEKNVKLNWNDSDIICSFLAFNKSDSITVDPHKMGYIHYPSGVIAFKNDRIRHFISHDAPYITSAEQNILVHNPPRHIKDLSFRNIEKDIIEKELKINIDSFAKFILEGSKPGAAAASLKFVTSLLPITREGYGEIIKQSILAALEFYEWLEHWDVICMNIPSLERIYKIVPVTKSKPDTNVIIFSIMPLISGPKNPLLEMNKLTESVYNRFTIQAEFGSKEFSYSQPFFLSKEPLKPPTYNYDNLSYFFHNHQKCGLDKSYENLIKNTLEKSGLTVLRATIMNPYLHSFAELTKQNLYSEFFSELHKCVKKYYGI